MKRNWEKRQFENSDIDSDWDMLQVRDLSLAYRSSKSNESVSSESKIVE